LNGSQIKFGYTKTAFMKSLRYIFLSLIASTCLISCDPKNSPADSNSGNWVRRSDFAGTGRSEAVGFTVGNFSYLGTGWDGDNKRFGDFWKYDPAGDSWTQVASLPQGAERSSAVGFSVNGFGYCGTGYDGSKYLNDFYKFDPVANTWTKTGSVFPGTERSEAVAFVIGNLGYVGTGFNGTDGLADFYSYNPTSDSWTNIGYPGHKRYGATAFVYNNQGYIVTGIDSATMQADFWTYNPNSDTSKWTQLRHISNYSSDAYDDGYTNITRWNASSFVIGDKGYISTGENGIYYTYIWEYDFASDLWTQRTPFEGPATSGAVGFGVSGKGFLATGRTASGQAAASDNLREFQPDVVENPNDN
jgi:N-acetylneuraminic acid mutarotase